MEGGDEVPYWKEVLKESQSSEEPKTYTHSPFFPCSQNTDSSQTYSSKKKRLELFSAEPEQPQRKDLQIIKESPIIF